MLNHLLTLLVLGPGTQTRLCCAHEGTLGLACQKSKRDWLVGFKDMRRAA